MLGELSDSKPYVAANVVLEDVDYRVYEDNNQYMDLVWNNCLSFLIISNIFVKFFVEFFIVKIHKKGIIFQHYIHFRFKFI